MFTLFSAMRPVQFPLSSVSPASNLLAALAGGLLQGQQELPRVLLGMRNQVLKALHLRQPADAALLGEGQVVINDIIIIVGSLPATAALSSLDHARGAQDQQA